MQHSIALQIRRYAIHLIFSWFNYVAECKDDRAKVSPQ